MRAELNLTSLPNQVKPVKWMWNDMKEVISKLREWTSKIMEPQIYEVRDNFNNIKKSLKSLWLSQKIVSLDGSLFVLELPLGWVFVEHDNDEKRRYLYDEKGTRLIWIEASCLRRMPL